MAPSTAATGGAHNLRSTLLYTAVLGMPQAYAPFKVR
jgi:hypothetical protein